MEQPYQQLIEDHQDRFKAAYAVDGWLCCHAGLARWLAKDITDVYVLADMLNDRLAEWLANPCETTDGLFAIGKARGGSGKYNSGGIFWFDFKREGDRLADVKQIFGHTETKTPVVTEFYVALDTTNNKDHVYLFDTQTDKLVVLPMPPKLVKRCKECQNVVDYINDDGTCTDCGKKSTKTDWARVDAVKDEDIDHSDIPELDNDLFARTSRYQSTPSEIEEDTKYREHMLKTGHRLRNLPIKEQGPFKKWLCGQTMPLVPGIELDNQDFYYEVDYRRWKAGLEPLD